jgi:hypothetical protein
MKISRTSCIVCIVREIDQLDRYEWDAYLEVSSKNGTAQSKTSVYALSAILERPLRLLWPQVEYLDMPENSGRVFGRDVPNNGNPAATLMFTSCRFDGQSFNFNHWVPLVQSTEVGLQ